MTPRLSAVFEKISSDIGEAVLLPVALGTKKPLLLAWQQLTLEDSRQQSHLDLFTEPCNIGVLLGAASGGLCSIDLDDDAVSVFLELNPAMENTLRTAGARGCNFWMRAGGDYPPTAIITHRSRLNEKSQPLKIGEWRSTGSQTIIYGRHPSGCNYRRLVKNPASEISFDSIVWPAEWRAPFIKNDEEKFIEQYGAPYENGRRGGLTINQTYFAAKFTAEHDVLWLQNEREFYFYDQRRGLWQQKSVDFIKQQLSRDLLSFARKAKVNALVSARTNSLLNSLADQLRGLAEKSGAFDQPERGVIHLANGFLNLKTDPPLLLPFAKEFYSRNQCPIELDESATCPTFESQLLRTALDEADIGLLQRWCGAVLIGGNHAQKILFMIGTAGGGKSTLVDVVERVIGVENIIELRPSQLHERFEIGRFLGKRLLTGKDVPGSFLKDKGASALKKLVGHDHLSAEKKICNQVFQLKGTFDCVVTCNSRLRVELDGDADAWRRRLVIIQYERPKPATPIRDYATKLIQDEGSGILNWMLEGAVKHLAELETTGEFAMTERQKDRVESLLSESDGVRQFVLRCVKPSDVMDHTTDELVQHYKNFCEAMNWQPETARKVENQLPDLMMEIHRVARRNDILRGGKSLRGYKVAYVGPEQTEQG